MEDAWERGRHDPLAFEGVCSDPKDSAVSRWLLNNGITRVVVGHKPSGDCPAVLSRAYTGVEFVSADTSFSDPSTADMRGRAVPSVLIRGPSPTENQLVLSGLLRDGREYAAPFQMHGGANDGACGDPRLGTEDEEGWWYKVRVAEASTAEPTGEPTVTYLQTRGDGRHVEYRDVTLRAAMQMPAQY